MLYLAKIKFCDETAVVSSIACMRLTGSGNFVNCQFEMMIGKLDMHDGCLNKR